jgi:phosphate transport system permease protein
MMDVAVIGRDIELIRDQERSARIARRFRLGDSAFKWVTLIAATTVLALLAGVMLALVYGSLPAWRAFGLNFLVTQSWNPVTEKFGALASIYGTLATSAIAMLIGVPVSLGIAFFLTEICPERLRRTIGIAIELLAGIPSIIYGIWGLFVFAPWFQVHVQPLLIDTFANVPVLNQLFAGPPYGVGLLTAGLILSIMVLPFITSITREVFATVPPMLKEAAYGIGCTRWEVMRRVVLPYTRVSVTGAVMLGLGRALGETMAVTFVIGNAYKISSSLFAPGNSIASALANEFNEAADPVHSAALIMLGLVLFLLTFIVLAFSRLLLAQLAKGEGRST